PERIRYVIGISLAIAVGAVTLIFIGILINELLDYRNRYYAVTNQRFIIQHGTISVGHISLYTKTIITLSIDVNIADKLLKKGTGSISFGTGSTKLRGSASDFRFDDIPDVYKNYKRFKKISDSHPEKEVETSVLG
ncbi:MAG TPA: PH domain-containing protein, partial [Acholeplasmataceae bacterium]|nr:PH domain-containing protein [Acholeplasmataceae bacterium]